ncbi:lysylphosphatidylglycerol synthase transmembrane domain-containing protein [Aeromicrobium sp. UC242_57]|uniref:lysylphosphatidylglycerol synthase transmembrane domain-containing protein n=1 Tax=Aeromicrobium sp. UC242_57 TaxID=3374624 RepID=UPI0037BEBF4F
MHSVLHSRVVLVLTLALAIAIPALTLPRLPEVTWWPVLLGLLPWVVGKYVLCPLRWRVLTTSDLSGWWFIRANAEAELLGLFTPGHVGTDLWRMRRLNRSGLSAADTLASVGLDRLVGAIGLTAFVAFAGTALPVKMISVAIGVAVLALVATLVLRRVRPDLMPSRALPPPRQLGHALLLSAFYQLLDRGAAARNGLGHGISGLASRVAGRLRREPARRSGAGTEWCEPQGRRTGRRLGRARRAVDGRSGCSHVEGLLGLATGPDPGWDQPDRHPPGTPQDRCRSRMIPPPGLVPRPKERIMERS